MAFDNPSPRLFIGTLYSQENEYAACVRSIQSQTYQNFDHFVFTDLPNKEAHVALFSAFLEKKDQYDLLIKVDADMVISNPDLFEMIVKKMVESPSIQILSIAVHDFFSDQLIFGLNTYRNTVHWDFKKEKLFVDIPEVPREGYLFDETELAPAAVHCADPTPYQAFHYGVHHGLKMVQPEQEVIRESSRRTKWTGVEKTWDHYRRTKDRRLALACIGAELAYAGVFIINDLDVTSPRINQVLKKFSNLNDQALRNEVLRYRCLNFGFLPFNTRRKVISSSADHGRKNFLINLSIKK
jgi:glycosyltransferase involved in cell wall biosynthesis